MRGHLKVFSRGNEMNYNQSAQHSTAIAYVTLKKMFTPRKEKIKE